MGLTTTYKPLCDLMALGFNLKEYKREKPSATLPPNKGRNTRIRKPVTLLPELPLLGIHREMEKAFGYRYTSDSSIQSHSSLGQL